ncbi:MAG: DUF4329 domain-containing protein [Pseudomonadota bacterium]
MRLPGLAALLVTLALPAAAQDPTIVAVARDALSDLQAPSFRENREFCGIVGRVGDGRMAITRPSRGSVAGCSPRGYRGMAEVVATYHTHGAFLADFDNEVPSLYDLESTIQDGVDGFVATPGGRFWWVDPRRAEVRLICGPGCLPSDPRYVPEEIPEVLTLDQLRERTRTMWEGG